MHRSSKSLPALCAATLTLVLAACATKPPTPPTRMTQEGLVDGIRAIAGEVRVDRNVVEFEYRGIQILAVSDPVHDRMRLISPITTIDQLSAQRLAEMLVANFHTSLDGRYAIADGTVFAAFLHPLSSLDAELLASAIRQVAALQRNFGTTYSSDELTFGGGPGPEA
ncbi:MAG: hypothetical protein AAGC67_00675 [Myxococcota bacterium]